MHIAITADFVDVENIGGAGRVLWEIAGGLLERGHELTFLVGGPTARHEMIEHPKGEIEWCAFPYQTEGRRGLRFLHEVRRSVRERFLDVRSPDIFIHNQPLTADALRATGVSSIYMFHSPWPCEYVADRFGDEQLPRGFERGVGVRLQVAARRRIEKRAVEAAKEVITLSRHMRDRVVSMYGVDPTAVRVCPGGVDLDRFQPLGERSRAAARRRWNLDDRLGFVCVRRLVGRTGVDLFVDALRRARTHLPEWRALIAGRGPESDRLIERVRVAGLSDSVTFLGYVPDEELASLYAAADIAVVPTRALEGFGLATLESLACGTPVVATPVGGTVEILKELEPRLLAAEPTPDALAQTLIEWGAVRSEERTRLRERAATFAEEYRWDGMAQRVLQAAESASSPGRKRSRGRKSRPPHPTRPSQHRGGPSTAPEGRNGQTPKPRSPHAAKPAT